jgi:acid phosphatase
MAPARSVPDLSKGKKMPRSTAAVAAGFVLAALMTPPVHAQAPRYDHVVIVVMENHGLTQVIGNASAPYITALARQGAEFSNSHGVAHPSQPNYLALFSGSTQGIVDDSCPHSFAGDNLGAQLASAGLSFAGYSESMPTPGYTGCVSGKYARKHNPWVNFPNVPASASQPLSAFPADPAALPSVAFVVPNLANDMHDGSVATGDAWLKANIDAYAQWAKTHNSLLILTFDEADYLNSSNLVPTVMVGAGIVPGTYKEPINHYSVLATVESMFGLPRLAPATPIIDVFSGQALPEGQALRSR